MPLTDEEQKFGEVSFIRVSDGTAGLSKSAPTPGPSPRSRPSAGRLCPRLPNARRRERSPAAAAPPPDPVSGSARPVRESALTVGRAHPPRLPLSRVLRARRVTLTRLWCLPKTTPGVGVCGWFGADPRSPGAPVLASSVRAHGFARCPLQAGQGGSARVPKLSALGLCVTAGPRRTPAAVVGPGPELAGHSFLC